MDKEEWREWLVRNIDRERCTSSDFGLRQIAQHLGKEEALKMYWEGSDRENDGDITGGIALYKRAFKAWPALDSVTLGGLPSEVRREAKEAGAFEGILLDCVSVPEARASKVMFAPALLDSAEVLDVEKVKHLVLAGENVHTNNPENGGHHNKQGVFLHNPPGCAIYNEAPHVLGKILKFAQTAWNEAGWTGTKDAPGPLYDIAMKGGLRTLNVRCVEAWTYTVGGGLVDKYHNDTDSVLTLVCLLSDPSDFDGGAFRTWESDGTHMVHAMAEGDAICFLSHKFHNIVPLTRGVRKSLVIELWQGGVGHKGR